MRDIFASLYEKIVNDPLGYIIGVIGIVVAIYVPLRVRQIKRPRFLINSYNLIKGFSSNIPNLNITYSGTPIDVLTISRVAVWNSGRGTLRRQDIPSASRPTIIISNGAKILDAKILGISKDSNQFSIELSRDGRVFLTFEYLGPDDGAVIQLVHTGTKSDDIDIVGTFVDSEPIKRAPPRMLRSIIPGGSAEVSIALMMRRSTRFLGWIIGGTGLLALIFSVAFALYTHRSSVNLVGPNAPTPAGPGSFSIVIPIATVLLGGIGLIYVVIGSLTVIRYIPSTLVGYFDQELLSNSHSNIESSSMSGVATVEAVNVTTQKATSDDTVEHPVGVEPRDDPRWIELTRLVGLSAKLAAARLRHADILKIEGSVVTVGIRGKPFGSDDAANVEQIGSVVFGPDFKIRWIQP